VEAADAVAEGGGDVILPRWSKRKGAIMQKKHTSAHHLFALPVIAGTVCLLLSGKSVAQSVIPESPTTVTNSPAPAQISFATANEAAQALLAAAQADDVAALLLIFGEGGQGIVTSGDPVQDKNHRARFVARAKKSMKLQHDPRSPNRLVILLGEDNYPFAVPITRAKGRWRFDTRRGRVELLARRIGSNELDAIGACFAFVRAQFDYAAEDHNSNGVREYAQNLISSPGTKDGLFWPASSDDPESPLAAGVTKAIVEGYTKTGDEPAPYHGYYFKILRAQGPTAPGGAKDYLVRGLMIGGFGLVAWPAEYGVSGIKTFLVNQEGVIYEKDLGTSTANIAQAMMRFNPDKTWHALR
jgi:hypothetical protein